MFRTCLILKQLFHLHWWKESTDGFWIKNLQNTCFAFQLKRMLFQKHETVMRPLSCTHLPQHSPKWICGRQCSSIVEIKLYQWKQVSYPGRIDVLDCSCNIKTFCIRFSYHLKHMVEYFCAAAAVLWCIGFVLVSVFFPLVRCTLLHLSNLPECNFSLWTDSCMQSQTPQPTDGLMLISLKALSGVN